MRYLSKINAILVAGLTLNAFAYPAESPKTTHKNDDNSESSSTSKRNNSLLDLKMKSKNIQKSNAWCFSCSYVGKNTRTRSVAKLVYPLEMKRAS